MHPAKKARILKFTFLLNAFVFGVGGIGLLEEHKPVLAGLQLITGLCNLFMVFRFIKPSIKKRLNYTLLLLNILVTASIAIDSFIMGKKYIQYVWVFATIMSGVAFFIQWQKNRPTSLKN